MFRIPIPLLVLVLGSSASCHAVPVDESQEPTAEVDAPIEGLMEAE
jgi:hypothetical protein